MSQPADFDRIARLYQALEYLTLGPLLERTRNHFLPRLADRRQALVLGDGDGRFLARLLAGNQQLQADAVDRSGAMLTELRRRCAAATTRLRTHQQDALTFTPSRRPDLVVTHFFLDCLSAAELQQLVTTTVPRLAPGALWLVSEFRIPETGPTRLAGLLLVRGLYGVFRVLTGLRVTRLPEYDLALRIAGLVCREQRRSFFGMLSTELWQLAEPPMGNFSSRIP